MLDADNPVWVDVWKFYMAIESDACQHGLYTQDYILDILRQILKGNTNWDHLINEAWEKDKETYSKMLNSPSQKC